MTDKLELTAELAAQIIEKELFRPSQLLTWVTYGFEPPVRQRVPASQRHLRHARVLRAYLRHKQAKGQLIAGVQDNADLDAATYIHVWIGNKANPPADVFAWDVVPGTIDHRFYIATTPNETARLATKIISTAQNRDQQLYFKYIQQGLDRSGQPTVNDQLDQIVVFCDDDHFEQTFELVKEVAAGLPQSRRTPFICTPVAPGVGYSPDMLANVSGSKTTPLLGVSRQLAAAIHMAVAIVAQGVPNEVVQKAIVSTDLTDAPDRYIQKASEIASKSPSSLEEVDELLSDMKEMQAVELLGVYVEGVYNEFDDEQRAAVAAYVPIVFNEISDIYGYGSADLRANHKNLINASIAPNRVAVRPAVLTESAGNLPFLGPERVDRPIGKSI